MAKDYIKKDQAGVPVGGDMGQVLTKQSGTDFDYEWSAGSATQDLQSVTDVGNTTTNSIQVIDNSFDIFSSSLGITGKVYLDDANSEYFGIKTTGTGTDQKIFFNGIDTVLAFENGDSKINFTSTGGGIIAVQYFNGTSSANNGIVSSPYDPNTLAVNLDAGSIALRNNGGQGQLWLATANGGGAFAQIPISVNGNFSDAAGDITVPTVPLFTQYSVPYADASGILTEDNTGFAYDGADLSVGHSSFGTFSGFFLNGGRASIQAAGTGMLMNVGSGFAGPVDTSKSYSIQNKGVDYVKLYSTTTSDHFARFYGFTLIDSLATGGTAPTTSGTTRMVITDANGQLSFATTPTGTVTSVSGTTNRITSTGGATPVIDISATFEALLGKVASPLSQFASTTSAQLAGVISDETGSGALVFGTSPAISGATITTSTINGVTPTTGGSATTYLNAAGAYTTPASTISSVSNADGTLTISPTTGAVVASLALGHANLWTGFQTFSSQATVFTPVTGSTSQFVGLDGAPLRITFDTHNNASSSGTAFMGRRSRGTAGTPLAVQSADTLFSVNARGYGTSQYAAGSTGLISFVATEAFTNTANGTSIRFDVTPNLSVTATEIARLTSVGLGIGQSIPTAKLHITTNAIGVTQNDANGGLLQNTTAASLGNTQYSPPLIFEGMGWGTTAGTSQSVKMRISNTPVQNGVPGSRLVVESSSAGGAYAEVFSAGSVTSLNGMNMKLNGSIIFSSASGSNDFLSAATNLRFLNSAGSVQYLAMTSAGGLFTITPASSIATSGTVTSFSWAGTFAPTSGTAVFNSYVITPTINQTGVTGTPITRGLYINPTLTAASDFRGLEVTAGKIVMPGVTSSAGTLTLGNASEYIFTGTTTTWTLPALTVGTAASCVIYNIKNAGSGNITLNSAAGGNDIYNTSAVSTLAITPGQAYRIVGNGTAWYIE